jgi:signal transduction histidine kinase
MLLYQFQIIEDITDLSKLEINEFRLNYQWFSLHKLIDEVYEILNI